MVATGKKWILFFFFLSFSYSVVADVKFIQNKGQWNNESLYRAQIPNGYLYIMPDGICYQFYDAAGLSHSHNDHHQESSGYTNVYVRFEGGSKPVVTPINASEESYNYFIGKDESKWAGGLKAYSMLLLKNVYKGISLKLYFNNGYLKYDWLLEPETDAKSIRLEYKGADHLAIINNELVIKAGKYQITEEAPVAFTKEQNLDRQIPCYFQLTNKTVTFRFPHGYDNSKALIIDPKLIFSSYSGSLANNWGNTATYDDQGCLYSGGIVFDQGFPVTPGTFQSHMSGSVFGSDEIFDVAILKFSSDGRRLIYATYLGGEQQESPHSMIVNKAGELIVLGSTSSDDFPVTNNGYDKFFDWGYKFYPSVELTYVNGSDMFVVMFSADGSSLKSGTYLGGTSNDGTLERTSLLCRNYGDQFRGEVNLDVQENILIASRTQSGDFPVTAGAKPYKGGVDGVLVKFKPDLSDIIFSTYIGGSRDDVVAGVCSDKDGNIYVAGGTLSADFQTTVAGVAYKGGDGDAFVQKYSSNGLLLASTLTGTDKYDQAYFVNLGTDNSVYIYGQTSGYMQASSGVYANPNSGQFIMKFSNSLSVNLLTTVVGAGNGINISPTAFLVNECDMIFISGWGGVQNRTSRDTVAANRDHYVGGVTFGMPIGAVQGQTPYQRTTDGSDFYLMVLDANASKLLYSTYFGGLNTYEHVDGGTSRFDKKGNIYHSVCACRTLNDFPTTPGAVSAENRSSYKDWDGKVYPLCNNAAFKFDLGGLVALMQTYSEFNEGPDFREGCAPLKVNIKNVSSGGVSFFWDFGDGATLDAFDPNYHTYEKPGLYKLMLIARDPATCKKIDTAQVEIKVNGFELEKLQNKETCIGDQVTLEAVPIPDNGKIYEWSRAHLLPFSGKKQTTVTPANTETYYVKVTDLSDNCSKTDSTLVTVYNLHPKLSTGLDNNCDGVSGYYLGNNTPDATSSIWNFGDGTTGTEKAGLHKYKAGDYTVNLISSNHVCSVDTTFEISVTEMFVPNVFTPNGDGLNDRFEVTGIQSGWKLNVYNRWGKEVMRSDNYFNQWDGGSESDGVYYYLLTSPFDKTCKGWVQIIR